ncbi:UrcA family protein [Sphingomonas sp. GCM10030256]|uniref:UrcA family protein n=1 Tax=Sphingomonas sp. GCM10030256 TaxID=3273427 RepID=UPI003612391D
MKNNLILGLAAMAASTTLIAPTVARAGTPDVDLLSERVPYADLNLATAKGQVRLESRVAASLRRVCDNGLRDARSRQLTNECIDRARQKVDGQVQLAVLTFKTRTRRA